MKVLFVILGFIFFGLGAVGAVIPVLPTVPFLLLASVCFAKGSERFNNWFLSTKLYRKHLESFVRNRSMTLKTKIGLCAFASTMLLVAFLLMDSLIGRALIVCVIAFKYYYFIFRIKTIKPEEESRTPDDFSRAAIEIAEERQR